MDDEMLHVEVCRTEDGAAISDLLRDEDILPTASDDHSAEHAALIDTESLIRSGRMIAYGLHIEARLAGAFLFVPHSTILYETHIAVLARYRGVVAVQAALHVLDLLFAHTPCHKVFAMIPDTNRHTVRFARMVGLEREGRLRKGFLKGGALRDLEIVGITREGHLARRVAAGTGSTLSGA